MKHLGIKVFLLILFLVLVAGAAFMIIHPEGLSWPLSRQERTVEPVSVSETQPKPEAKEEVTAPAGIPEATPAPTPAPQPAATPEPAPTPDPYGVELSSGAIESGKPWLINIHADWAAVTAPDNKAEVTVIVYVDHYALNYDSTESLNIRLGDNSAQLTANAIDSDVNRPQSTEIGRKTFTVPLTKGETVSLPLAVSWNFVGKYVDDAGHYFDIRGISCDGTVTITG